VNIILPSTPALPLRDMRLKSRKALTNKDPTSLHQSEYSISRDPIPSVRPPNHESPGDIECAVPSDLCTAAAERASITTREQPSDMVTEIE
jgi:hypothetical protein